MSSPAIILQDVWLRYRVPEDQVRSLKAYIIRRLKEKPQFLEGWALRGISLEIQKGEVLGIVGRNGAGKTTLLKLISRVLKPTRGWVRVEGTVAPLLGLGAGFHDDLTGRENIFLASAILGYREKDVARRVERIVAFAELEPFIDRPLRTYSTGMRARLGFAVATDVRPQILILDEVLAVGDETFQEKCKKRIEEFREAGTTVLLVSHQMATIKALCTRAILLEKGELIAQGKPEEVVTKYHLFLAGQWQPPRPTEALPSL
jgi:ABC-type polysaccharide/polyol phosphate transport system ATPase subunit